MLEEIKLKPAKSRPNPVKHLPKHFKFSFLKNVIKTPTKQTAAKTSLTLNPLKSNMIVVKELPKLQPIVKDKPCIKENKPMEVKPTVIIVEAVELCIINVNKAPLKVAFIGLLVNLLTFSLTLLPVSFCKFSLNILTPKSIIPILDINKNIASNITVAPFYS